MKRLLVIALLTFAVIGLCGTLAAAADPTTASVTNTVTFDWKTVISTLLNSVLVVIIVQVLTVYLPVIKAQYPMVVPIAATLIGPIVGALQAWILQKFGISVDFSPILSVLAGGVAVTMHQIGAQTQETKRLMMIRRSR